MSDSIASQIRCAPVRCNLRLNVVSHVYQYTCERQQKRTRHIIGASSHTAKLVCKVYEWCVYCTDGSYIILTVCVLYALFVYYTHHSYIFIRTIRILYETFVYNTNRSHIQLHSPKKAYKSPSVKVAHLRMSITLGFGGGFLLAFFTFNTFFRGSWPHARRSRRFKWICTCIGTLGFLCVSQNAFVR